MERIYINNDVKCIAKRFAEEVKNQYRKSVIDKLKVMLANKECTQVSEYLQSIIDNYDNLLDYQIVSNTPPTIEGISIPTRKDLSKKISWINTKGEQEFKEIYKIIVDCMQYDAIRDVYVKFISELHIRSCVYCNANYAVTRMEGKVKKAQFEIDHFFPKSKYPHLCTSFFNFQPCCGCCNKFKGDTLARFNLYTSDANKINPYSFQLMDKDLALYSINGEKQNLSVRFIEEENDSIDDSIKTHDKMFHISGLYKESFTPEVLELVKKHEAFNESARKTFKCAFPQLTMSIDEILYGTFINEENIHVRPLTKLLQDVHQQLNDLYQENRVL